MGWPRKYPIKNGIAGECPICKHKVVNVYRERLDIGHIDYFECDSCGHLFCDLDRELAKEPGLA